MKKRKEALSNYSTVYVNLNEFNKLNLNEQNEKIRDILADAYGGRNKIKADVLLKIINLAKEKEKKTLHFENSVNVENNNIELIFSFSKIKILPAILFYIGLLIFLTSAATFAYLGDMKRAELNIDIDNDGIAEINIDIDGDEVADVNIDINNDKVPEHNIDYMDNWVPTFNILNKDGTLSNIINQDTNNDGICDINCDINGDGWPEFNLDLDGDGTPDMFLDPENEGYASMNIDSDGDTVCDIQCDTNRDGKCDKFCLDSETIKYLDYGEIEGNNNNNLIGSKIPTLTVEGEEITCNDLYPTDQPEEGALKECTATLKVNNLSSLVLNYRVVFNISDNTYTSQNFKYRMIGTNGATSLREYTTVPSVGNTTSLNNVRITAATSHTYNISFILQGTGDAQNYDANRSFRGEFKVELVR